MVKMQGASVTAGVVPWVTWGIGMQYLDGAGNVGPGV